MVNYYDYILAAIPAIIGGGVVTGILAGINIQLTLAVAALLTFPIVIHGMFIRGPTVGDVAETAQTMAEKTKPVSDATKTAGKAVSDAGKKAVDSQPVRDAKDAGKKVVGGNNNEIDAVNTNTVSTSN